jgi:hypothetical protein
MFFFRRKFLGPRIEEKKNFSAKLFSCERSEFTGIYIYVCAHRYLCTLTFCDSFSFIKFFFAGCRIVKNSKKLFNPRVTRLGECSSIGVCLIWAVYWKLHFAWNGLSEKSMWKFNSIFIRISKNLHTKNKLKKCNCSSASPGGRVAVGIASASGIRRPRFKSCLGIGFLRKHSSAVVYKIT